MLHLKNLKGVQVKMAMDVKYITPFIDATKNVLSQFGMDDIKKGKIAKKEKLMSKYPVTVVVGIRYKRKCNI